MKVSGLTGAQLDYWVAKVEGVAEGLVEKDGRMCQVTEWDPEGRAWRDSLKDWTMWIDYAPSQRWDQGGPIIERERIDVQNLGEFGWQAFHNPHSSETYCLTGYEGPTPLIAAMRAHVAQKFGGEVPDER